MTPQLTGWTPRFAIGLFVLGCASGALTLSLRAAGPPQPSGDPEIVVKDLPGVRQHGDKGIAFDGKGSLYVNVGAPSNACQTRDRTAKSPGQDPCPLLEHNGGIWKFDENKLGQTQ